MVCFRHTRTALDNANQIGAATSIYPVPMGVSFVIRSGTDGTFEMLGSIVASDWPASTNRRLKW